LERIIETPSPLVPWAMRAENSRGRRYPETPHPYRTEYARDRDRIIHSRAFRRLEAKTQVFTMRYSDHFRNRLTHTLEVSQIARTVAAALGLNTELAEALSLVHDIGHPPFGHAGEQKLDELMKPLGGHFNHNLHALHIVEQFEQRYLDFAGLNLTFEVREGIIKNSFRSSANIYWINDRRSKRSSSTGWMRSRTTQRTWTMHWKQSCWTSRPCAAKFHCSGKRTRRWKPRMRRPEKN